MPGTRKSSVSSQQQKSRRQGGGEELDGRILDELDDWKELRRQRQAEEQQEREDRDRNRDDRQKELEDRKKQRQLKDLRERLLESSERREAGRLRDALNEVEQKNYVDDLRDVFDSGVDLLRSIDAVQNLQKARDKFNHNTVVELRNLNNMNELVHQIVIAAFQILGYSQQTEPKIKTLRGSWPECQKEFVVSGEFALHKRVQDVNSSSLQSKTVCDAMAVLDKYDKQFVHGVSGAAGLLYDWVAGLCEEKLLADDKAAKNRKKQTDKKKQKQQDSNKQQQQQQQQGDDGEEEKYRRCEHCVIKQKKQQNKTF